MTTRQQLEDYDEWLEAKYREVLRDWHKADAEGREKYDALLKAICVEIKWVEGRAKQ